MSDPIISVENLGKKYSLRHQRSERYTALRDVLTDKAKSLFRRNGGGAESSREDFWALKNVSFEVKQGEVLGIIGRNGAGKTTVLKILSRITEPTEGRVRIRGRVASLLEVGTGFHPELTGRENIYLNGAILGMSKAEIKKKFDEIVAFAETEKFLDTPVKRYSSGMYVRLAFAVAAHLEPEILVVDEVLAVGDAEFQKKCLGKMQDVSTKEGRTVLFVSHNMAAVVNLCSGALLLTEGRLALMGESQITCAAYANESRDSNAIGRRHSANLRYISLLDAAGAECRAVREGEPLRFRCALRVPEERCLVSLIVRDARNSPLFELFDYSFSPPKVNESDVVVLIETDRQSLLPGRYSVDFWLGNRMSTRIERIDGAFEFDVVASGKTQTSLTLNGSLRCLSKWKTCDESQAS